MHGATAMPVEEAPTSQRVSASGLQEWERTYAMWTHLLLLAGFFLPVVPSLILWLIKRDQSSFVDDHGKEAVNFQISLVIYMLVSVPLIIICGLGYVTMFAACVVGIVGMILAAVGANRGQYFRYPMSIRLIR